MSRNMKSIPCEPMRKCCVCGETRNELAVQIDHDSALAPYVDGICVECYRQIKRLEATVNTKYVNVQKIGVEK